MSLNRQKINAIDALARLADGMDGKSETAKIRVLFDSVELALSSGVNREKVLDTLRESIGIKMNFRTFETTLHRIRKERKQKNIDPKNTYPVPMTTGANNQLASYSHNENKNTDLVGPPSVCKSTDIHLVADEEGENEEPKTDEREYRKNIRKSPNIAQLHEIERKYKEEQKEKKKREQEQANLKK